jgi:hypothetical protein
MNTTTFKSLAEKEKFLQEHIALPSLEEYAFYLDSDCDPETKKLLKEAIDKILLAALDKALKAERMTFGEIVREVYVPLGELQKRYSNFGICDSETFFSIARFWGLNYCPEIYDLMRYPHQVDKH